MYGALLGCIIGSPYEFDMGPKVKEFPLFRNDSVFTGDCVLCIAVAETLMDHLGEDEAHLKAALVESLRRWGGKYIYAGFEVMFLRWLNSENTQPYGSCGNGAAVRANAVGWLADSLQEARRLARITAEVTHNHPEAIRGAECVACAVWLARKGRSKAEIKKYIVRTFGYNLSRCCAAIRPTFHHMEGCQDTVPPAITAFLEGTGYEDVIRTTVSLGGDCDTLASIAGGIAEAYYGVPEALKSECRNYLPKDMMAVADRFWDRVKPRARRRRAAH